MARVRFKDSAAAAEDSDVSTTLSCAQCGATLRPDQGWCALCFASVEEAFDPLTAPLEEVVQREDLTVEPTFQPAADPAPTPSVVEPETGQALETIDRMEQVAPLLEVAPVTAAVEQKQGVGAEPSSGPGIDDVDVMLSMLAAEHRQNDRTSALVDRMSDKGTRLIVMFGGAALIALVVFVALTALGFIF